MLESERTVYPLGEVRQFMKKYFCIRFLIHVGLKFNHKVSWFRFIINKITIPIDTLTLQSTMLNIHINFVTWVILIQKPRGNILTEFLRITVSRSVDARHVPQCINQMNDDTNRSFSLLVISYCICKMFNNSITYEIDNFIRHVIHSQNVCNVCLNGGAKLFNGDT